MEKKKLSTKDMAYIGLFACLMAICAWISIPGQIPFTLQTMGVFLAVGLLGGKQGTLAVLVYVLMGAVGLPVFSGFTGGIGRLLGATGGYIIGFLASALLMWALEKVLGEKKWGLALSMLLGLIACYAFGTAWFLVVYTTCPTLPPVPELSPAPVPVPELFPLPDPELSPDYCHHTNT